MALTQAEIKQLIAENFPPKGAPKNLLTDTFETKVAALSDDVTRRNRDLRRAYDEDHDEREASRSGNLDGRIRDDMHGDRGRRLQRVAEEKRKERAETAMYLAMLQDRINGLNDLIGNFERQTAATDELIELLNQGVALNPNDPRHKQLMDAAGIPDDQRNGITSADLERHKKELQEKTNAAKAELAKTQAKYDDLARANDNGREIDFTRSHYDGAIEAFERAGSTFNRNNPSPKEVQALRRFELESVIESADRTEKLEQRLFNLEELADYRGPDRTERIDEFVSKADETTIAKITNDPEKYAEIGTRIGLMSLKMELSEWDQYKGTPDYAMYVQTSIENYPNDVIEALRSETDLGAEITEALYQSFSDTLDGNVDEPSITPITSKETTHDPDHRVIPSAFPPQPGNN